MKKLLTASLIGALALGLFACGGKKTTTEKATTTGTNTTAKPTTVAPTTTEKKQEIKILTPSGTPLMAIGGLIGSDGVDIEAVNGAAVLQTELPKGDYDIIIAPLTLGAKFYIAGTSKYVLDAVVTTNNTYIIAKGTTTLTNITDLKNKKIVAYGKNNTPDIALMNAIDTTSGITKDDVDITYVSDVNTAMSSFTGGNEYDYCLIAEPQLSKMKSNGANITALDLSEYMSTTIYQAGIFVNPDSNQTRCNEVIEEIKTNITYLNAHSTEYANQVLDKNAFFTNMTAPVIAASIPNANISFIKAKDNKNDIKAYFTEVNNYNAAILGGTVTDAFFR